MHQTVFLLAFFSLAAIQIQIEKQILDVEIADTHSTRSKGLMGREELGENSGMLFIYDQPQIVTFWMKNTLLPLSIAFFDREKVLFQILDMDPPTGQNLIHYVSQKEAVYALEVNQGWFQNKKIGLGAKFAFLDRSN